MDTFKNLCKVTLLNSMDASGTTITLTTGEGNKLPAVSFNGTIYNSTDYADPTDDPYVEIVRVTGVASDVLTVTRAQESTTARAHNLTGKTYKLIVTLTAKTINDEICDLTTAQTLTNKTLTAPTLTSPVMNTGVSGTAVLDEDDLATDSNTQLATQQSIKAYVDGTAGHALLDEDKRCSQQHHCQRDDFGR